MGLKSFNFFGVYNGFPDLFQFCNSGFIIFEVFLHIYIYIYMFVFSLLPFWVFLVGMPVGFKMFGQPALFHIPLANVAEYFLLIIYFVTLLLFVQAFNTHSIHSIELVTIFAFLTLCALSTLHTIIRYYHFNFKCISLYLKFHIIWYENLWGSNINSLLHSFIHFVKLILVNNCISNKLFIVFDIQQYFFLNNL